MSLFNTHGPRGGPIVAKSIDRSWGAGWRPAGLLNLHLPRPTDLKYLLNVRYRDFYRDEFLVIITTKWEIS